MLIRVFHYFRNKRLNVMRNRGYKGRPSYLYSIVYVFKNERLPYFEMKKILPAFLQVEVLTFLGQHKFWNGKLMNDKWRPWFFNALVKP